MSSEHNSPNNGNHAPFSMSSAPGDLVQAQTFLDWWFAPAFADPQQGDMRIILATIKHKGAPINLQPFDNTAAAARWAVEQSAHTNVYTHIAAHCPDLPKGKGSIESALCLPGVAVDLDAQCAFRGDNKGKAPDVASLRLLTADFETHYQFHLTVIESGFGLYDFVRFKEPLFLEDLAARKEAHELLRRFAQGFRVFADERDWPRTVECVPLSGILRVPGTWNRKDSAPLPVRFSASLGGVG